MLTSSVYPLNTKMMDRSVNFRLAVAAFDMKVDDPRNSFGWYLKGGELIAPSGAPQSFKEADGELPADMPTSNALIMGIPAS